MTNKKEALAQLQSNKQELSKTTSIDEKRAEKEFKKGIDEQNIPPRVDPNYKDFLRTRPDGHYTNDSYNAKWILLNDSKLKDKFYYDEFADRIRFKDKVFWNPSVSENEQFKDIDEIKIREYFNHEYKINFSPSDINSIIVSFAFEHKQHPVKVFIESNIWDGEERAENFFITYLKIENSDYAREITRKWLLGTLTRVYNPGCKFEYVVIFMGAQGIGKSSLFRRLAGRDDWFLEDIHTLGKATTEKLRGKWIAEFGELDVMAQSSPGALKSFISTQFDTLRQAYARHTEDTPRTTVFTGSTNETEVLQDTTGNRRFLILKSAGNRTTAININDIPNDYIQQLWVEVKTWYDKGESFLLSDEAEAEAERIANQHVEENPYQSDVDAYINEPIPYDFFKRTKNEQRSYYHPNMYNAEEYSVNNSQDVPMIREQAEQTIKTLDQRNRTKVFRDRACWKEFWDVYSLKDNTPNKMTKNQIKDAISKSKFTVGSECDGIKFGKTMGQQRHYKTNEQLIRNIYLNESYVEKLEISLSLKQDRARSYEEHVAKLKAGDVDTNLIEGHKWWVAKCEKEFGNLDENGKVSDNNM